MVLLRLLGLVSVESEAPDGSGTHVLRLSSAQAQVALARLVLDRGQGTSRDCLSETIWPTGVPDTWASAQRSVISRVRRFLDDAGLGQTTVDAVGGRYLVRLPPDTLVDVEEGERLCRRAEDLLVRGAVTEARAAAERASVLLTEPLLPDQEGEWVLQTRLRFWEQRLVALELHSQAALACHDTSAAIAAAQQAIRLAPLRESAYHCLTDAHAAGGNRAEALLVFDSLRTVLREELGIEPSAETCTRQLRLSAGPDTPGTRAATPRPQAAVDAEPHGPGGLRTGAWKREPEPRTSTSDFVGRRPELARLDASWRSARSTLEPRLVLVTGEPGIGATRLVDEFVDRLDPNRAHVLPAHRAAAPTGGAGVTPLHPLVDTLTEYGEAGDDPVSETRQVLSALSRSAADAGAGEAAEARRTLARALAALACDRPLLVAVDRHSAGEGVWAVLHRLLDSRPDHGVLVLVLGAPPEGPGADLIRAVERAGRLDRVPLGGLSQSDIYRLVSARVADVDLRSRLRTHQLHRDTGGNPFLVGELIRAHVQHRGVPPEDGVTPGVLEYTRARRQLLPVEADRLLQVAALAGDSFELDLLAEVSALTIEAAIDALDDLLTHGLVAEQPGVRGPGGHQFCHQLVRRAVVADLNAPRRQRLHVRFADVIERRRASELRRYARDVARHRSMASGAAHELTVRSVWQAAQHAVSDGALTDAARLYDQALAHVPDHDLPLRARALTELGLAQLAVDPAGAESTLLDAAVTALSVRALDVAARAGVGLADVAGASSEEARAVVEAVLESVHDRALTVASLTAASPTAAHPAGSASDQHELSDGAPSALLMGRLLVRARRFEMPIVVPARVDDCLSALGAELDRLATERKLEERRRLGHELIELAEVLGRQDWQRAAARHVAASAAILGDDRVCREAVALLARPDGDGRPDSTVLERLVAVAVREGRYADARAGARLLSRCGSDGAAARESGDRPVQAQLVVEAWLRRSPDRGSEVAAGSAAGSLAEVLAGRRGRPMLAVRAQALGVEPLPTGDRWSQEVGLLALCAVELQDRVAAERLVEVLAPYAGQHCGLGHRSDVGTVAFHLGRLHALLGHRPEAERHLLMASAQLSAVAARPWVLLAQHDLARLSGHAVPSTAGEGRRPYPVPR